MTSVWDRQNPRVSYQVPVGVLDPEAQLLLSMISINLSEGGMFVDTPEELPIGKELVCNLPLSDNRAMQVRARVAWQRAKSASDERRPRGVGIEFIDLSVEDAEQLAQIVGEQEELSHAVRLQVDGMKGVINAQAQLTPHGIFFRSSLPFLQLNSQVDFAFEDDKGHESYQGRIVDVKVHRDSESPVPRLQVEVELLSMASDEHEIPCGIGSDAVYEVMHIDCEDTIPNAVDVALDEAIDEAIDCGMDSVDRSEPAFVRGRGRDSVDLHFDEDADESEEEAAFAGERASDSDPILLVVPKRQPAIHEASHYDSFAGELPEDMHAPVRDRRLWIGAAMVAALVVGVIWARGASDQEKLDLDNGKGSLLAEAAEEKAKEKERVRALIEGPLSAADSEDLAPSSEAESETQPPVVAKEAPPPRKASAPATGGPKTEPTAATPAPAQAPARSVRATKDQTIGGIRLWEDDETFSLRLPIEGSEKGASHYMLADPAGIAINMPQAQPSKGYQESIAPESDAVRRIWVRERLGGIHFRVYFKESSETCETEYSATQVVIRCKRGE